MFREENRWLKEMKNGKKKKSYGNRNSKKKIRNANISEINERVLKNNSKKERS